MPGSSLGLDAATWARLSPLLDEALELPPVERAAWLDRLPDDAADLRQRLRDLLADDAMQLATSPGALDVDDAADDLGLRPGDEVGVYRIIRPLGTGGMGVVWLAERADGMVARQVALKLPRAEGARAALAARMARERVILAALDHPHIARLYDAGIAADGQPYLALEFVEGERIDRWCALHSLDIPARLQLFLQAARAVAYAHAQLVVHRDLKPSNLLVAGDGQVKLLDFGIAKLLDDTQGATSELTARGAPVMTPAYASPEQVGGLPVGTRSDVYALGVLLYELLAGVSPYKPRRDSRAALEEAVLSEVPARPSDAAVGARTRRALRGDLDAIVLQALRKLPAERYATVDAFIDDIERHLRFQPVLARREGWVYPLRKFVRRHRLSVGASAAVVGALLVGLASTWWQADRAERERERAEQVKTFITDVLRDASPYSGGDVGKLTAVDLMRQASRRLAQADIKQPEVRVELMNLVGESLLNLGDYDRAEPLLDDAVRQARAALGDDQPLTLRARLLQGELAYFRGRVEAQQATLAELLPRLHALAPREPALLVQGQRDAALNALVRRDFDAAIAAARSSFELAQERLGTRHDDTLASALLLSLALSQAGRLDAARDQGALVLQLAQATYPGPALHPRVAEAHGVYGLALAAAGDARAGVAQLQTAVDQLAQLFGADSLAVGMYRQNMAGYQIDLGELDAAAANAASALAIIGRDADRGSYPWAVAALTLSWVQVEQGRDAEALALQQQLLPVLTRTLGPNNDAVLRAQVLAARAELGLGKRDAAAARLAALAPALASSAAGARTRAMAQRAQAAVAAPARKTNP